MVTINDDLGKEPFDKLRICRSKEMAEFVKVCRRAGIRVTPQRMAVYKALAGSKEHPSAVMVYREVKKEQPNISLDTVNRTLQTLSEIGAAFVVEGSGGAVRYDADMEEHQHFKCLKCKRIIDFHEEGFDNVEPPASIGERFVILRKTVYFEGICETCREKS